MLLLVKIILEDQSLIVAPLKTWHSNVTSTSTITANVCLFIVFFCTDGWHLILLSTLTATIQFLLYSSLMLVHVEPVLWDLQVFSEVAVLACYRVGGFLLLPWHVHRHASWSGFGKLIMESSAKQDTEWVTLNPHLNNITKGPYSIFSSLSYT